MKAKVKILQFLIDLEKKVGNRGIQRYTFFQNLKVTPKIDSNS